MDNLNRLLRAKEGHWDGSTVTDGNAKRDEVWTLDQTGNWELFKRDLDGDLNYTDALELKDRRTHNVVNELLTRDIDDNSSVNFTLVYDDNGNLTDDGEHYTYEYDAFGRLRKVKNRSTTALVSEYRYNGLGHRIGWHYDVDADGTVESNTDDPWFLFVYDDRWRIVNTYRLEEWAYDAGNPSGSEAKERFVYHQAGLGGRGGSSYIDSVMLRDRDANTGWGAASDGTMEERIYYAQNWRHDVSALITDDGRMIEWVKYSSYGVPMSLPAGDTDSDGDFDSTDAATITGTYDVRKDVNLDGTVDIVDYLDALDLNGGLSTQGWSILSNPKWNNRKGYAGYEGDTVLAGTKWHVRHRVLESELGRWMRRDLDQRPQDLNWYTDSISNPLRYSDPQGLRPRPTGSTSGSAGATGSEALCCRWWISTHDQGPAWLGSLPSCPCTLTIRGDGTAPNPDPGVWKDPSAPSCCHPGAVLCLRSIPAFPGGSGQQCCFSAWGRLITKGPAAGTPDLVAPEGLIPTIQHFVEDVRPYNACSSAGMLCRYHDKRPPNNGNNCPPDSAGQGDASCKPCTAWH